MNCLFISEIVALINIYLFVVKIKEQQNTGVCQLLRKYKHCGLEIGCSKPDKGSDSSLLHKFQTCCVAQPDFCSVGIGVLCRVQSAWGVNLTTNLHLESMLRISGAILLSPYVFMVWTRTFTQGCGVGTQKLRL
jgi:hypothetical protein